MKTLSFGLTTTLAAFGQTSQTNVLKGFRALTSSTSRYEDLIRVWKQGTDVQPEEKEKKHLLLQGMHNMSSQVGVGQRFSRRRLCPGLNCQELHDQSLEACVELLRHMCTS